MHERIARLGRAAKDRRLELGLTQQDIARAGGPSDTTQTGIESGTAQGVHNSTLRRLEDALQWEEGSARAVMDGEDPRPIRLNEPPGAPKMDQNLHDRLVYLSGRVTELSTHLNECARQIPELRAVAEESDELARFALVVTLGELVGDNRSSLATAPFRRWVEARQRERGEPPLPSRREPPDAADPVLDELVGMGKERRTQILAALADELPMSEIYDTEGRPNPSETELIDEGEEHVSGLAEHQKRPRRKR